MSAIPQSHQGDALLTERDASDVLRLSIKTLQAWRSKGRGPAFVRAGRAIRYRRNDLIAWIDANIVALPTSGRSHFGNGAP